MVFGIALFDVLALVATVFFALYVYALYSYGYWERRGVPSDKAQFPFGSLKGISRVANFGTIIKKKYLESRGLPFYGIFMFFRPILLIRDPALVKEIIVKNFSCFHDRGFHLNTDREPLLGHLFFLEGQKWRNMRIKMAPTFTSGKMKMMFPTILHCSEELVQFLEQPAQNNQVVEVKDIFSKFTINIIGRCAFGLDLNTFENPDSELRKVSNFLFKPSLVQSIKTTLLISFAKWIYYLPINFIPPEKSEYFINEVTEVMRFREENGIKRNDFMQLLIQLKNKGRLDDSEIYSHGEFIGETDASEISRKFTMSEATAQAFVFFVAGFEPASTTIQFVLYELALNSSIQTKLCQEIDAGLEEAGGITYEAIQAMTYLDQVISETLRKYPTAAFLVREARSPFKIPESDAVVEKGGRVIISVMGLHHDPKYFPLPDKFDPDRFHPSNKDNIQPYTYLPFGEGPRICIGMRFALLQIKVGLVKCLAKYKFELCADSPTSPLQFDPKALLISLKGGMNLRIKAR